MIEIRETTAADLKNIQRLWADGDVMRYVGFPEGLHETDEEMGEWLEWIDSERPLTNHYSIYENGEYCGETFYAIDTENASGRLDIKLFASARGRGIASGALAHAIDRAFMSGAETVWVNPDPANAKAIALYERLGFVVKDMPEHVIAMDRDAENSLYMEIEKATYSPCQCSKGE